jgi:predicted AAA+ superfamily ATPase
MSPLDLLAQRAATLLDRLDQYFPPLPPREPDWNAAVAFRWRIRNGHGYLEPVRHVHHIALSDLHNVDMQKQAIERNTRQFIAGKPANNVLLTGARGTGKSSLVKAVLNRFAPQGLRLIEVEKSIWSICRISSKEWRIGRSALWCFVMTCRLTRVMSPTRR